jgi:hypothetical protein
MSNHLSDKEFNGYIHQTLTDAQRETMTRHVQQCAACRTRLQEEERLQRQVQYELHDRLQIAQPPATMRFSQIQGNLNRRRRVSQVQRHSMQMLSAVGTAAIVLGLAGFLFMAMGAISTPVPLSGSRSIKPLFDEAWDDVTPYLGGLVLGEQATAATMLAAAPTYYLDLYVEDNLQKVNGRQQLRYQNTTDTVLHELLFRVYPNLTDGELRILDLWVNGDVTRYGRRQDSAIAVALAQPLQPGDEVVVQMDFVLEVAPTRQQFGGALSHLDETLSLAYFYPRLAAYHADSGWDVTEPAYGAVNRGPLSFYRVRVTAPEAVTLVASGVQTARYLADGRQTVTFASGPTQDFYLMAGTGYAMVLSEQVGETRINSYVRSDQPLAEARAMLQTAVRAFTLFTEQFGPYPYTELDLVGSAVLGFQQPAISLPGVSLLALHELRVDDAALEQRVVQEMGWHWFGALAQQPQQEPWLAVGLPLFVTRYYDQAVGGETAVTDLPTQWQGHGSPNEPLPLGRPAREYTYTQYQQTMRGAAPIFVQLVGDEVGMDVLTAVLQDYYQSYRWLGGSSALLQETAEIHCNCDLTPLWDTWVTPDSLEP